MPELPSSEPSKPLSPKSADDINKMFAELDEAPVKEVKEPKEPKESAKEPEPAKQEPDIEEVEDDDIKLKGAEDDEEKLDVDEKEEKAEEDLEIDGPPRKKEILKAYPDLFKKFPFLEKMMYRDREWNALFGSFDDAKEVAEKAEVFNNFESQLLSGSTEEILKQVKSTDEKAFNLIVDDYLQTLYKVDKDSYFHVTNNLNKRLIMEMVEEAKNSDNEDLKTAAALVHQFLFGSSKFTAPTRRVEKIDEEKPNEVEQERQAFVRERFESSRDELQGRVDNILKATISDYIDPNNKMSPYEKKNAIVDAMKILSTSIAADAGTVKNLDKLWRAAFENKFSKEALGKIQSYYLSRAKGNLKNAIIKARAEALKDSSPKGEKEEIEEETPQPQARRLPTGRPSQQKGKFERRKGESVADFFARD